MSKFYSAIHIFALLCLLGLNNCDAFNLTYWDARHLHFPLTVSALPWEPAEPHSVRGQKCEISHLGFNCCVGVKPSVEPYILHTCVEFVQENEYEWTLTFIMANERSGKRHLQTRVQNRSRQLCRGYPHQEGVELCVIFSPLNRPHVNIHFKTLLEGLEYDLYFDTLHISSPMPHGI